MGWEAADSPERSFVRTTWQGLSVEDESRFAEVVADIGTGDLAEIERRAERPDRKVARLADAARSVTAERDEAIRAAVADGETLRTVADWAGLSHTAIRNIAGRPPS